MAIITTRDIKPDTKAEIPEKSRAIHSRNFRELLPAPAKRRKPRGYVPFEGPPLTASNIKLTQDRTTGEDRPIHDESPFQPDEVSQAPESAEKSTDMNSASSVKHDPPSSSDIPGDKSPPEKGGTGEDDKSSKPKPTAKSGSSRGRTKSSGGDSPSSSSKGTSRSRSTTKKDEEEK